MRSPIRGTLTAIALVSAIAATPALAAVSDEAGEGISSDEVAADIIAEAEDQHVAASQPEASTAAIATAPSIAEVQGANMASVSEAALPIPASGASIFSSAAAQPLDAGSASTFAPKKEKVSVSANATITTDYRFRGVSLSDGDEALQGGVDIDLTKGFYVGGWGSSLAEVGGFGSLEIDLYGGWSGKIGEGVTLDTGVIYYIYPDAPPGDFDYVEFYSSLEFTLGPAAIKGGTAYAPDQSSLGDTDNFYIYSDLSSSIPGTPISLIGHVGYTDGALTYTADNKAWDYSFGAEWAINSYLTASTTYVGVEGPSVNGLTDDTLVFSITAEF